ncbi:MAG: 16S rRNA (cytosine(1402)-N(4))-methyltransferase RsmH [Nitrospinae bacterium]|nr:16S rRNA (cytosine(1402)-N(4))-methyltransferase RsmH [Nitrospinota bacterium]
MTASHVPVMVQEVLRFLAPSPGAVFLDTTLGGGEHSGAVLDAVQPSGVLIGCDRDRDAVEICRKRLAKYGDAARIHRAHHGEMKRIVRVEGYESVDGVLFDLGLSSMQLDTPGRGFRISAPEPLDMRMDQTQGPTAADLIEQLPEEELADLIYRYGEERHSRAIARAIGRARAGAGRGVKRCDELAALIASVAARRSGRRGRSWRIHPATRTFQALRIAVNRELETLEDSLRDAVDLLRPGGRIVVISFHSLEDRIVKNLFRELAGGEEPALEILTRRVVRPEESEVRQNPRSRSAKLRAAERLGEPGG